MTLPSPPQRPRRIAYLGTPDMAVPPLRALHESGFEVVQVVSRPDRRRDRGGAATPSPVKAAALELGLSVTDDVDDLVALGASGAVEAGVVVAFGQILRRPLLAAVPMVNLHFSLLPRWRGAAPVERAILAGDDVTGVCVMEVEEGLDTGGVYRWGKVPIGADETADELRGRLVSMGTGLLLEALLDGLGTALPQEGEETYARKIDPEELRIDWSAAAVAAHRQVRVGGAWTTVGGRRLKVHRTRLVPAPDGASPGSLVGCTVACGEGAVELIEVQPEGRARVDATSWRNGARLGPDARLGS